MSEQDVRFVSHKLEEKKEYFDDLSLQIWKNPELAFQEFFAHQLLTSALKDNGFTVQKNYIMETGFRAEYSNGNGEGAVVALMCEYDCLPNIGHACGHNLIAEAGIAAGIAVKETMQTDASLIGKIVVLGSPAEEGGGGKMQLIDGGAFQNVDAALMAHPCPIDALFAPYLCVFRLKATFIGKEAHASVHPWDGINALDAVVAAYVNISLLRQQIKPTWRINAIIPKGGSAPNVIPDETEMQMLLRAPNLRELEVLKEKVVSCLKSASNATGCEVKIEVDHSRTYLNVIGNKVLGSLYREYAESMGIKFADDNPELLARFASTAGSTDMGNVSYVVPAIHPLYKIGETVNHTREFTDQAMTDGAHQATRTAAQVMALTAIRLMRSPELLQEAKIAFHEDLARNQQ